MTITATITRKDRVNEYVLRDVLGMLMEKVTDPEPCEVVLGDAFGAELLSNIQDYTLEPTGGLLTELWPEDEDTKTLEFIVASARMQVIVGQVLLALTSPDAQAELHREGLRMIGLAEEQLRDLDHESDLSPSV